MAGMIINAERIYTGSAVVEHGSVVFDQGRIKSVTAKPDATPDFSCAVITPAFIDPHSHIGMIRAGEPGDEAEANDQMDSMIAHADALDSVQMDDRSFRDSIEAGVLYSCVVPGSGNIIGGRSAVIRNYGADTNAALVARAGIKAAIGYNPMSTRSWKGTRPYTRMGALSLLRGRLHDVREKMKKKGAGDDPKAKGDDPRSADEEIYRALLKGRERLRVHVHKIDDIAALLRLVDEFHLKVTVEHSCDVHTPQIYRELASRSIPVVYGPVDSFAYKVELKHESWRNIAHLLESGVEFGLMTDHPVIPQQMLLFGLRWFLRLGLSREEAIGVITRRNAKILGIDAELGTLEPKKWASLVCWNGDPFDVTSYPVAVYGEGIELHREPI
jgi:imidazolonepropionase-like amidohydrolase